MASTVSSWRLYQKSFVVQQFSRNGTYRLSSVSCYDVVGKSVTFSTQEAFMNSNVDISNSSYSQLGAGDVSAPKLMKLVVFPTTINTSLSAQSVTIELVVSDDASGLSSCSVFFSRPNVVAQSIGAYFNGYSALISGTLTNGTFRTELSFPRYSLNGTW